MEYLEIQIRGINAEEGGILIAELSERGFESFAEEEDCIKAYITAEEFRTGKIEEFLAGRAARSGFEYQAETMPDKNWNEIWEAGYQPVLIAGRCMVRAPFHQPDPSVRFDLVIEPKMSFGTAHHETTRLMIETLLKTEISGKKLLDMGCGTGVLSVLASKLGARLITAIDNDEWAYRNTRENILRNKAGDISVILGDARSVPQMKYDIILANINRNILLEDMPAYSESLEPGGLLLLSGFLSADLDSIGEKAAELGMEKTGCRELNDWIAATFRKC